MEPPRFAVCDHLSGLPPLQILQQQKKIRHTTDKCHEAHIRSSHSHSSWQGSQAFWKALDCLVMGSALVLALALALVLVPNCQGTTGRCCEEHIGRSRSRSNSPGSQVSSMALEL